MNVSFRSVAVWMCGLAAWIATSAAAAPQAVGSFDGVTWRSLQASLDRPTAVVFSTTDCVHCPAAIEALAREIRRRKWMTGERAIGTRATGKRATGKRAAELVVVVMDRAPGDDDARLMRDAHYRAADRLFAFSGQGAALRYSVNPDWRGVTPFVAFLVPGAPPVWVAGLPSETDMANWVKAASLAQRTAR